MSLELRKTILELLSLNDGLSSIKLHNLLKKQVNYSKSYQNTNKILRSLLDEGVVYKDDKNYCVCLSWVSSQLVYYSKMRKDILISSGRPVGLYTDNNMQIYELDSLLGLDSFWVQLVSDELKNNLVSEVCWEGHNCWWLFINILHEKNYLDLLRKNNVEGYFLIKQDTLLNKKAKNFYDAQNMFSNVKKQNSNVYLHRGVVGDLIIETVYDSDVNNFFDELYSYEDEGIFLKRINDISNMKTSIVLKVVRNPVLAKLYTMEIKKNCLE